MIGRRDARIRHTWNIIIGTPLHVTVDRDPKKQPQKREAALGGIKCKREIVPFDFDTRLETLKMAPSLGKES